MQVVFKKEGYNIKPVQVDYSHKGSTAGKIILGGGIGYLVDRGTGAACKYPPSIFVAMDKNSLTSKSKNQVKPLIFCLKIIYGGFAER
ncbi:hypothetical protein N9M78_01840 [Alphaproteobacteria bacterium]|nr:hypothetical protein [Alphaproteobacteria bacterium]